MSEIKTKPTVFLIGGSGIGEHLNGKEKTVRTEFGDVPILVDEGDKEDSFVNGGRVIFVRRHGDGHTTPPHNVNYRGIMRALQIEGVEWGVATTAVGVTGVEGYKPGDIAIPTDFFGLNVRLNGSPVTMFNTPIHTPMTHLLPENYVVYLVDAADGLKIPLEIGGTIHAQPGPRYESAAEVQELRRMEISFLGMTTVYEWILATELDLHYVPVAICTNWAAGMTAAPLSHQEVMDMMHEKIEDVMAIVQTAFKKYVEDKRAQQP